MLIWGLGLGLAGILLLRIALRQARRVALFSSAFWQTFPQFARYRLKRLWPAPLGLAGAILLIWGLVCSSNGCSASTPLGSATPSADQLTGGLMHLSFDLALVARGIGIAALELGVP